MPFTVTQASSVMMSSSSPTNGAQDLHENLLSIGDAAFPGLSNQNELNWTENQTMWPFTLLFFFLLVGLFWWISSVYNAWKGRGCLNNLQTANKESEPCWPLTLHFSLLWKSLHLSLHYFGTNCFLFSKIWCQMTKWNPQETWPLVVYESGVCLPGMHLTVLSCLAIRAVLCNSVWLWLGWSEMCILDPWQDVKAHVVCSSTETPVCSVMIMISGGTRREVMRQGN